MVESLLRLVRLVSLDWSVPDFSTVCRRQKTLRVQLPYRASTTALDLLVDSTGIKFLGEGEWKRKAIVQRGAQAGTPPRKNGKPWKTALVGAGVRNEALKACGRLGCAIWKQWSGDHRRSLVETKMHGFKRLGERVMARTFERQVVELHVRVALLNRFTQLGRPTTVPVPAMA
jgi:hypothetical protein